MSFELDNTLTQCPRCDRWTEASQIWVWINGQAERLRLVGGAIKQSERADAHTPDLFDLACGCAFKTSMWALRVRAAMTTRRGKSLSVYITPRYLLPDEPDDVDRSRPELERLGDSTSSVQESPFRIDPAGCGCTDCLTGYSVPMDSAKTKDLYRMLLGKADNATGHEMHEFTLGDPTVITPSDRQ